MSNEKQKMNWEIFVRFSMKHEAEGKICERDMQFTQFQHFSFLIVILKYIHVVHFSDFIYFFIFHHFQMEYKNFIENNFSYFQVVGIRIMYNEWEKIEK